MAKYGEIFSYYTPFNLYVNLIQDLTWWVRPDHPGSPHGASASGDSSLSRLVPRAGADHDDFPTPFDGLAPFRGSQEPRLTTLGGFMSSFAENDMNITIEMLL